MHLTTKPKPVITKITISKEEQEEIKTILAVGKPNKYTKGRAPASSEYKIKLVKQFYGGYCHVCRSWPSYKLMFDMGNAQLKEFY